MACPQQREIITKELRQVAVGALSGIMNAKDLAPLLAHRKARQVFSVTEQQQIIIAAAKVERNSFQNFTLVCVNTKRERIMERRARDLDSNSSSPTELSCHLRPLSLVASSKNFNEGILEMLGGENNVCQEALCERNQCVILFLFYNVFTPFLSGPVFVKTIQIREINGGIFGGPKTSWRVEQKLLFRVDRSSSFISAQLLKHHADWSQDNPCLHLTLNNFKCLADRPQ